MTYIMRAIKNLKMASTLKPPYNMKKTKKIDDLNNEKTAILKTTSKRDTT